KDTPTPEPPSDGVVIIGADYELRDVVTEKGAKLHKGGRVKLVHVFPAGHAPDREKMIEFTGWSTEAKVKALDGACIPYREHRLVLRRETSKGIVHTIISGKQASFLD